MLTVTVDNHTISWSKPETTLLSAYVVEWYPKGHKLEELRWVRLGSNDKHTVMTGGTDRYRYIDR